VVDTDNENKGGCGNCAWASVCAWPWTAARGGEGEQYPFRCRSADSTREFQPICLETGEVEPFSGEEWAPTAEVSAFASLFFEIVVGDTATPPIGAAGSPPFPAAVPAFVSRMIEERRSPESARRLSFAEIVTWLEANRFEIMTGVDSDEVSAFVSRVESPEQAGKRE
jgi:hypothetical protein